MTEGHVTHAEKQGVHVLRYFGTVNFMLAPGLQRWMLAESGFTPERSPA